MLDLGLGCRADVALLRQFSGVMNAFGWGTIVVYFLFASGHGYFLVATK